MDGNAAASISLRPGGSAAANPFSAFSQGAGVKAAPQKGVLAPSATPHTAMLEERKKELGVDLMKYSAKFMLQFAERYNRPPASLASVKGLIVDDVTKTQVVQKTVQSDTDNWRSNNPSSATGAAGTTAGAASTATNNTTSTNSATADRPSAAPAPGPALGMLRAEDVGRQKWQPAKGLESSEQAQQKLRGILNKLTPDNFDRLLTQVLGIVSVSTEVLRKCIPLLFEKAVAEPKFCALYADLSAILSKELASHDFGTSSEGKPISFKRELLNTCQDEFEGMEEQREKLRTGAGSDLDIEQASRKLKLRQLGTLRLLAELFNRDLLTPAIMKIVTAELLARSRAAGVYDSELIECVVQAIAISGQKMSKTEKLSKPLKQWLDTLSAWSNDPSLEARIRFKIKDLQDQIAAGWYSKMDANTVKKTEEIRKQAETELGIVPTTPAVPDFLPGLNIGVAAFPVAAVKRDPSALFPAVSQVGNEYGMPIPAGLQPLPDVRPDQPDSAKDTSGPSVPVGSTPDEQVRKKAHGTFQEFLSIRDFTEAETCMRELALSVAQQGMVVATALNDSYDVQQEAERDSLRSVVVHLADTGILASEGIQAGFQEHMAQLDDLAVDIPLAPPILGKFLAALLEQGSMPTAALEGFFEASEMAEPKRGVFKHLMRSLAGSLGQRPAAELFTKGDVHVGPLLDADKTLEPGLPSVFDFVKMEQLDWVPL